MIDSVSNRLSNGGDSSSLWMMGATLNPNSSVAKEMDACLKDEIQTHAAYDPSHRSALHGVPFPGAKRNSNVSEQDVITMAGNISRGKVGHFRATIFYKLGRLFRFKTSGNISSYSKME